MEVKETQTQIHPPSTSIANQAEIHYKTFQNKILGLQIKLRLQEPTADRSISV